MHVKTDLFGKLKTDYCCTELYSFYCAEILQTLNIDGLGDCPDMFPLMNNDLEKYVIMSTNGKYDFGIFDVTLFTQKTKNKQFAFGDT